MPSITENFDIVGSYNNQRISSIDSERSINCFEYIDPLGKKIKTLLGTSGLINTHSDFGNIEGGFRAQFVFNNFEYDVVGNKIFRISTTGTITEIGTINTTFGYVGVDANQIQIIFVDGLNGYIWNTLTNTFTTITDPNFPTAPIDVCYLDGFFIVPKGGTNQFYLSQLNDGTNWTPATFGAITSHPGTIVACRTLHRRLFLFSQYYTEVWENAGLGTSLPFRRNNSLLIEYGTPAIGSVAVGFDMMFFQSQDRDGLGAVMQVLGTAAIPVSTRALDYQLAQYAQANQVADCRAFLIKENGLIFYRMNFTAANHTFVYDVTQSNPESDVTKLWHEEETLNHNRHPAQTHAYFNGNNYVGNYALPIRYEVDDQTYTNDGEAIRRARIWRSFVPPGYQRIRIDRLQIDFLQGNLALRNAEIFSLNLLTENGVPILTEDGDNILLEQTYSVDDPLTPYAFLSISKDGGQTYGYVRRAPMGGIGERTFRTLWRKIGTTKRGQPFIGILEFFEPSPFVVLGASWSYEVLPE